LTARPLVLDHPAVTAAAALAPGLLLLLTASTAHAEWRAPAECPSEAQVRQSVERTLGAPLPEGLVLAGHLEGQPSAWRVTIRVALGDEERTRELRTSDPHCDRLADAIAVVTALLVDELLQSSPPTPLAVAPAPPPARSDWRVHARLAASVRVGELPGVAPGAALELEVGPRAGPVALVSVRGWGPASAIDADGVGGRFVAGSVALGICHGGDLEPWLMLGACGAGALTYLLGEGVGVRQPARAEGAMVALEAAGFLRVRLGDALWARLGLGLAVPVLRPRAVIQDAGTDVVVHEAAPVVPTADLGLELRFE
jgi:hypothetical protein